MALLDFLQNPIFSSRYKLRVHLLQFVLVSIAVGLSVPRLFMKGQTRSRNSTIALGMGAKSLILLLYLILSEQVPRFQCWHSYKAHAIIACLEILFWSVVAGLIFRANTSSCTGVVCGLSWGVVVTAVIVVNTEIYAACIAIREFREYRNGAIEKVGSRAGRYSEEDATQLYSTTSESRERRHVRPK